MAVFSPYTDPVCLTLCIVCAFRNAWLSLIFINRLSVCLSVRLFVGLLACLCLSFCLPVCCCLRSPILCRSCSSWLDGPLSGLLASCHCPTLAVSAGITGGCASTPRTRVNIGTRQRGPLYGGMCAMHAEGASGPSGFHIPARKTCPRRAARWRESRQETRGVSATAVGPASQPLGARPVETPVGKKS